MQNTPARGKSPRIQLVATLLPVLALAGIFLVRAQLVDARAGAYTGCEGCFRLATMGQDAWLLGSVLVMLAVGCAAPWTPLRLLARLAAAALCLIAAGDLALFDLLSHRLLLDDVVRFGGDVGANASVLRAALAAPSGVLKAIAAALLLATLVAACLPSPPHPRLGGAFAVLALAVFAFAYVARAQPVRYVHSAFTANVIAINLPRGRMKDYSQAHLHKQRTLAATLAQTCESNPVTRSPNVIIVLAESLSAWHSRLLGSPLDWTPRLDAIARDNHYFTRFHANGFTTSAGEIALLAARVPFNPPGAIELNFDNYSVRAGSLPELARQAGYESLFFTPGTTGFLGIGDWLRWLGFDAVHGSDDAYYEGMPRWQFSAVEDRLFYDRFLDWLDARDDPRPYIATLLTVTSHPPFVDPRSDRIDPEGTFRYVDEQIGRLHDALRARGFLDDGVLIVMGDHRTMTPLRAEEYRDHGERAFARVPLVVTGAVDMPAVVDAAFQQSDLVPSLAWLLGQPHCRDAFAGSFLRPDPQPPSWVVHVRGDDRNRVDVYHGEDAVAGYRLDGDASRWLDEPPPDAERVSAWIDVQRADAARRREHRQAGR